MLDGKTEYNLKASHEEEAVLRLVVADNDEIRTLAKANREVGGGAHEDKVHLGEMVAAALRAREAADAELLQQELGTAAEAVSAGPPSTGWLASLSFLIDRSSAEQFLATVDQLRRQHPHLELRVNSPLPPYSFVDTPGQHAEDSAAEAFKAAADQPTNG